MTQRPAFCDGRWEKHLLKNVKLQHEVSLKIIRMLYKFRLLIGRIIDFPPAFR